MKRIFEALIDAMGRLLPVFLITPHDRTVGNTAEEIYYGLLYARRTGKRMIIARRFSYGRFPLSNRAIFELESPLIVRGPGGSVQWLACAFLSFFYDPPHFCVYLYKNLNSLARYILARTICLVKRNPWQGGFSHFALFDRGTYNNQPEIGHSSLFNPRRRNRFELNDSKQIDWSTDFSEPIPVRVPEKDRARCEAQLRELGVPADGWFVCWHVREGGYYGDADAPRNSDILNSIEAMQAVVAAGGMVIRMGDASMQRLPELPGIIDYPHTPQKSALLDLYLIEGCRFYVGSNSGILDVAHLFQKRCLMINATEWTIGFPTRVGCRALLKHIYSREQGRFLSLQEILKQPFSIQDLHRYGSGQLFIENTPAELKAAIQEMLAQLTDDLRGTTGSSAEEADNEDLTSLQEQFQQAHREQLLSFLKEPLLWEPEWVDVRQKFRISARALGARGTLGARFLEENWSAGAMNQVYRGKELAQLNERVQSTGRQQV